MTERTIGNYKILKQIGAGGMAKVYLAVHKDVPNLKVVLKILSSPQHAERFMQEADKLALLERNPNVCHIRHFFNHEDELVIAMEYIDGKSLEEMIAEKVRFSVEETAAIAADLLTALGSAHEKEIYHRDIKPGNVMFEKDGMLKIIDFGIAKGKADPQMTIVGTATGTPEYMAPEQFAGGEQLDYARCDIYAVGTMMYRMLTGEPPFKGANEFVLRDAKMFEDPVAPSRLNGEISGRMDKLILKAIDKDPARRFASALEMRDELLAIAGGAGGGKAGGSGGGARSAGPESATADSRARAAKDAGALPKRKSGKKGGRGLVLAVFAVVIVTAAAFGIKMMTGSGGGGADVADSGTSANNGISGVADRETDPAGQAGANGSGAGRDPSSGPGANVSGDDVDGSAAGRDAGAAGSGTGAGTASPPGGGTATDKEPAAGDKAAAGSGGEEKPAATDAGKTADKPAATPRTGPAVTPSAAPGYILVTSRPGHAAVYINGVLQNEPTPFQFQRPPGQYAIRIVKVIDGAEFVHSETVTLKSGEKIKISHNFTE
ncbi:MAG: protein kinase [Candidatus Krumholzibacteria bacterium]|nr:protein kinase [Candidatus Krumholzibacteria bacterium]